MCCSALRLHHALLNILETKLMIVELARAITEGSGRIYFYGVGLSSSTIPEGPHCSSSRSPRSQLTCHRGCKEVPQECEPQPEAESKAAKG